MPYCPACGAENPTDARFCRDCQTRLERTERLTIHANTSSPNRPPPPPPSAQSSGPDLERLCIWLGLLGIPGIVVGALLIRQRRRARGRPLAAVLLGSTVMLTVLAAVAGLASKPSPLERPLTREQIPDFAKAVASQVEELEEKATMLQERLGPGAESELAAFHRHLADVLALVAEMESVETEEDLDSLRELVLEELDRARAELGAK